MEKGENFGGVRVCLAMFYVTDPRKCSERSYLGFSLEHGSRDCVDRAPDIYTVSACVYCKVLKIESVHTRSIFM